MIKSAVLPCKASTFPPAKSEGPNVLKCKGIRMELTITRPDDWHLHLRDGDLLKAVIPHSSNHFGRGIVMPNLKPPVTTTAAAVAYRESILKALPAGSDFTPLMTLYLTDTTSPNEIKLARKSGAIFGVKLYPAGATTNSQDGVTDLFGKCLPVLEEMIEQNMPLLVHGEVTDPRVDVFDREKVFIATVLQPLIQRLPLLKVVMEHITTADAVRFVESCKEGFVAATVTPQHLLLNRNSLFQGGLQPHNYCLPVLKREIHRQAIVSAVTSGSRRFFLGTDSAPHEKRNKECSCGCAGIFNAPVALSLYAKVFEEGIAVVALLRHFGCPCCWELASTLKEAKERFDSAGVKLVAVGVGTPNKARILAERLPFPMDCLYADPDRRAYDVLGLYYGFGRTFFNPASAKVFSRFEALQKAVKNYTIEATPDDRSSVLQQGGMFVFKGKQLLYARKDEGTGDHAPLDDIFDVCCKVPVS